MQNDGFGALYNRRPLDVVLQPVRGGKPYKFRAVDDIRLLFPAPGERKSISLTIPVSSPGNGFQREFDERFALGWLRLSQ